MSMTMSMTISMTTEMMVTKAKARMILLLRSIVVIMFLGLFSAATASYPPAAPPAAPPASPVPPVVPPSSQGSSPTAIPTPTTSSSSSQPPSMPKCPPSKYGPTCNEKCHCSSPGTQFCKDGLSGDGSCVCRADYYGKLCDRYCDEFTCGEKEFTYGSSVDGVTSVAVKKSSAADLRNKSPFISRGTCDKSVRDPDSNFQQKLCKCNPGFEGVYCELDMKKVVEDLGSTGGDKVNYEYFYSQDPRKDICLYPNPVCGDGVKSRAVLCYQYNGSAGAASTTAVAAKITEVPVWHCDKRQEASMTSSGTTDILAQSLKYTAKDVFWLHGSGSSGGSSSGGVLSSSSSSSSSPSSCPADEKNLKMRKSCSCKIPVVNEFENDARFASCSGGFELQNGEGCRPVCKRSLGNKISLGKNGNRNGGIMRKPMASSTGFAPIVENVDKSDLSSSGVASSATVGGEVVVGGSQDANPWFPHHVLPDNEADAIVENTTTHMEHLAKTSKAVGKKANGNNGNGHNGVGHNNSDDPTEPNAGPYVLGKWECINGVLNHHSPPMCIDENNDDVRQDYRQEHVTHRKVVKGSASFKLQFTPMDFQSLLTNDLNIVLKTYQNIIKEAVRDGLYSMLVVNRAVTQLKESDVVVPNVHFAMVEDGWLFGSGSGESGSVHDEIDVVDVKDDEIDKNGGLSSEILAEQMQHKTFNLEKDSNLSLMRGAKFNNNNSRKFQSRTAYMKKLDSVFRKYQKSMWMLNFAGRDLGKNYKVVEQSIPVRDLDISSATSSLVHSSDFDIMSTTEERENQFLTTTKTTDPWRTWVVGGSGRSSIKSNIGTQRRNLKSTHTKSKMTYAVLVEFLLTEPAALAKLRREGSRDSDSVETKPAGVSEENNAAGATSTNSNSTTSATTTTTSYLDPITAEILSEKGFYELVFGKTKAGISRKFFSKEFFLSLKASEDTYGFGSVNENSSLTESDNKNSRVVNNEIRINGKFEEYDSLLKAVRSGKNFAGIRVGNNLRKSSESRVQDSGKSTTREQVLGAIGSAKSPTTEISSDGIIEMSESESFQEHSGDSDMMRMWKDVKRRWYLMQKWLDRELGGVFGIGGGSGRGGNGGKKRKRVKNGKVIYEFSAREHQILEVFVHGLLLSYLVLMGLWCYGVGVGGVLGRRTSSKKISSKDRAGTNATTTLNAAAHVGDHQEERQIVKVKSDQITKVDSNESSKKRISVPDIPHFGGVVDAQDAGETLGAGAAAGYPAAPRKSTTGPRKSVGVNLQKYDGSGNANSDNNTSTALMLSPRLEKDDNDTSADVVPTPVAQRKKTDTGDADYDIITPRDYGEVLISPREDTDTGLIVIATPGTPPRTARENPPQEELLLTSDERDDLANKNDLLEEDAAANRASTEGNENRPKPTRESFYHPAYGNITLYAPREKNTASSATTPSTSAGTSGASKTAGVNENASIIPVQRTTSTGSVVLQLLQERVRDEQIAEGKRRSTVNAGLPGSFPTPTEKQSSTGSVVLGPATSAGPVVAKTEEPRKSARVTMRRTNARESTLVGINMQGAQKIIVPTEAQESNFDGFQLKKSPRVTVSAGEKPFPTGGGGTAAAAGFPSGGGVAGKSHASGAKSGTKAPSKGTTGHTDAALVQKKSPSKERAHSKDRVGHSKHRR